MTADTGDLSAAVRAAGLAPTVRFTIAPHARRKNITVEAELDGTFTFRTPADVHPDRLAKFTRNYAKRINDLASTFVPDPRVGQVKDLVAGEGFLFLDRSHRLHFVDGGPARAERAPSYTHASWYLSIPKPGRPADVIDWYQRATVEWATRASQQWMQRLAISNPPTFHARYLGKRRAGLYEWRRHAVTISWPLLQLPERLASYTLVHELVHASNPDDMSHGPQFQAAMSRLMPDHEQRRREKDDLWPFLWKGQFS